MKKVEKIVSAIYLVTDHFSYEESLKWQLRKLSLRLMSEAMSLNKKQSFQSRNKLSFSLKKSLLEMQSFLDISAVVGLVSIANVEVFSRELNLLLKFIEGGFDEVGQQKKSAFKNDFFKIKGSSLETKILTKDKGHSKMSFRTDQKSKNPNINNKTEKRLNEKKKVRENQILKLFTKGQKLTIKDIAGVIDDCGEKTIQRGLLSLMDKGLIKKEGERRWSTYSLL